MYQAKRAAEVLALIVLSLTISRPGLGRDKTDSTASPEAVDTVEFLKLFHIGMTYADVEAKLPKGLEQDVPAYNTSDNVFMLGVGKSPSDDWGAYFVFDSSDGAMRKPEHLVEIDCSTTMAGRLQDFESLVREVSGAYGMPTKLDSSGKELTKSAGWRVHDDTVLTLEYTRLSGTARQETCLVDFVIRKLKYKGDRPHDRA